ncbi:NAD(P)H-hydrate epimerase [Gracilimonas tropica]|uniref:NAD(P)H-hydrate epimerase n=1 Tax=Gracilimonas tropica TaxID=454600 RepID=UPI0003A32FCB|nr:NAD(P)H-hydrate epimerase [Gracilimonas tropica]
MTTLKSMISKMMPKIPPPYYLSNAEQSRFMDEKTISEFGIDGFTLMEIAGTRAADFIQSEIPTGSHGLFFCGKGNNGGDALVIARLLSQQDYKITVCFLSGTDDLSQDADKNFKLLQKLDANIEVLNWNDFTPKEYDFVVDGMLGTGLNSDVRVPYSEAIEWINGQESPVFSLDIPTGLNADSGQIMGTSVQADFTLSFGVLKTGFYLNNGFDTTGEVILCELSFPNKYKKSTACLIDESWVQANTPSPKKRKHKYDEGVLYIVAGSEGLTGAGILAARSAWSAGLGAVILITPKGLLDIYEKQLEQIIKKTVGDRNDLYFKESHEEEVTQILQEKPGKLLIGPGLGRKQETIRFTQKLLNSFDGDIVVDADALFALSELESWDKPAKAQWILTPHPGELKSLLNKDVGDDLFRLETAKTLASQKKITVLSKGMPSIVGTQSGDAYLTGYDTRIFSRAGFGDVLAGKAAAYWVSSNSPELGCCLALLDGYQKSQQYFASNSGSLEPNDII